ncbi:ABC transporter permease [Geodermatophilus sp. CPCC 205761]|uniref:ABC transporter permease n=1 Tax=Geodermatophilus sp. CPCC 205761 TaxID=2936597 RepID=UPI003EEE9AE7
MPMPPETAVPWTENTERGLVHGAPWTALWRARELIGYFALRDLKLRYRQAAFGVVWVLFQPVASVAIFTVVFGRLAGISSQGIPYPLFALVGMVTWTYFASSVQAASSSLVTNANLVTKVYFPRMAAPAAALLPPGVDLGISLLLVAGVAAYYQESPGLRIVGAVAWLVFLLVAALGVSLWLSALNVRYRDVQHAVAPILQLWLFASPVAYPSTLFSGWQELVYAVNPMVGVIGLGRWSLLGAPWPGWPLAVSAVTAGVVLVGGWTYFNRAQRSFADVI